MKNLTKNKINKQAHEDLMRALVLLSGNCPHPKQNVVEMIPTSTPGKQQCLLCGKVRYQNGKGGPWKEWKQQ